MEVGVFRGGRDMLKCDENRPEVTTEFEPEAVAGWPFPRRTTTAAMTDWKALLIVYRRTDVRLPSSWFRKRKFVYEQTDEEVRDAIESFRAFPPLVEELSNGEARVTPEIAMVEEPLSSVTPEEGGTYWPSPDDTRQELDALAPPGKYDSVLVSWASVDPVSGEEVPYRGWGLGMGPSDWTNGATYAVVGNAPSWAWAIPIVGEVWLHEWLHGVCRIYEAEGVPMPRYDADGGGSHGYVQSKTTGWTDFYRDLMTGNVLEDGERKGIPARAWRNRPKYPN
jgi:hypothetical protein